MKVEPTKKIINYYSLENDSKLALTIGLFEALKDALKMHAVSEKSDHSLNYYRTYIITLDNPVIRALFQNKDVLMAKN